MKKEKILNQINKLIQQGQSVLSTKERKLFSLDEDTWYVDENIFARWMCQIKIFLSSYSLFKSVYIEFQKSCLGYSNFDYTNRYISLLQGLKNSIEDEIIIINDDIKKETNFKEDSNAVFIAHGRSKLWNEVLRFLKDDLNLTDVNYFEKESQTGRSIADALKDFHRETGFAIVVMTAEDDTATNTIRTRQNVIHEIGFFQGKLGFEKVAILKQDGVESFSNIDGIQYIPFSGDNISQTFYELQRVLKREYII